MELVGTRYYEAMASNSLLLCEESNIYSEYNLFTPGEHCVTFDSTMADFHNKLNYYLENPAERTKIAENGHQHVMDNHTWGDRVELISSHITKHLLS
jgi:spore maturation protein CgeB